MCRLARRSSQPLGCKGMRCHKLVPPLAILLSGLSAIAVAAESRGLLVVGTPASAEYTQWRRDWCRGGIPALSDSIEVCSDGSFSHGGEIHSVKLRRVTVVLGDSPSDMERVAIARHGMHVTRRDSRPWLIVLEPSPEDFLKATGIKYLARAYGVFDAGEACLDEPLSGITSLPAARTIEPSSAASCYRLSDIMLLPEVHANKSPARTRER